MLIAVAQGDLEVLVRPPARRAGADGDGVGADVLDLEVLRLGDAVAFMAEPGGVGLPVLEAEELAGDDFLLMAAAGADLDGGLDDEGSRGPERTACPWEG